MRSLGSNEQLGLEATALSELTRARNSLRRRRRARIQETRNSTGQRESLLGRPRSPAQPKGRIYNRPAAGSICGVHAFPRTRLLRAIRHQSREYADPRHSPDDALSGSRRRTSNGVWFWGSRHRWVPARLRCDQAPHHIADALHRQSSQLGGMKPRLSNQSGARIDELAREGPTHLTHACLGSSAFH